MTDNLFEVLLPHIKNAIYPVRKPLSDWKWKENNSKNGHPPKPTDRSWIPIALPFKWGGYDKTVWFYNLILPPYEVIGKTTVLLFNIPEGLSYLNGKPHQGVDSKHQEILLSEQTGTEEEFHLSIEAYSGRKTELNEIRFADIAVLDRTARRLYNSLFLLNELQNILPNPQSKEIREIIRRTLVFLKYFKPEGEEFPKAILRAFKFLTTTLQTEHKSEINGFIHLVGQSHIDVAWLWTLKETAKKCGRTFSTALQLMNEYPEFKYTQSQALLYKLTRNNYPTIFKRIKERITESRWEVVSPLWVEPDCNLPNGESLIRHILYGKRYFQKELETDSDILWLPDSFGFSASLPQIMKKSGLNYFFTTKLLWNDTTQFPYNTFWWRGIDGSQILTHNPPVGLEGIIQTSDITKSWDDYKQKDQSPYVIQTYGYGDGGGGPVRDHIEITSVINSILGFPQTVISSAREFFQKTSDHSGDIPVWEGELYLEKHRGAYTTHGLIKRENRKCEILLYNAELLSIMSSHWGTGGLSKRYPQTELEKAWKSLLMNQFHDILPGTSIPPVYTEAEQEYQNIRTTLNEIISNNLKNLINLETKNNERQIFTIFNPLNWIRSEYIEFEVNSSAKNFTISDDKNNTLEYQILGESNEKRKILCYVQEIPPLGMMTVTVSPSNAKPSVNESWKIGERTIETPLFKFRLDKRGQFSSLYDKKLKYDILKKGGRGNHLQTFRDTPNQWDAWDIDADFERHKLELFTFKSLSVIEQGPLRVTIRLEHVTPNGSILKQDIRLYHKISKIDFETVVDWHEKQTLLKTAFPLNLSSKKATYEIQFGSLERSTHSSAPEEKAKFEVPMQQWMDLSNSKNGISILNDCKYGGDAQGNTLRLTLIRSPFYPHPLEPWRLNDTRVTDQGLHKFTYSLYSHKGDWREGETVQRAREINNHLIIQQGKPRKALPSIFTITHKSIIIESIKRAEDSKHILVRLYESFGIERSVSFTCGFPVKEIIECDLLENDLHQIKVQRSKWSLKFRPFEIKTLKVLLKK